MRLNLMDPIYTLPTIHINGTGASSLLEEYSEALRALKSFRNAFADATCHARDFYPQGHEAFTDAKFERAEVFAKVTKIEDYLTAWINHIINSNPNNRIQAQRNPGQPQ